MKKLLALALVAIMACGAMAQDMNEFGLWGIDLDGEYDNGMYFPAGTPFQLYLTLHNTSLETVGGYEVSFELPAVANVSGVTWPNNGFNFGQNTNHLVGYGTPLPAADLVVLATINATLVAELDAPYEVFFAGANPPSVPGWDGPVVAGGENPDVLITAGNITGDGPVFVFWEMDTDDDEDPVAVEASTLSGVKALFE